jgi:HEAT repeat protein
MLNFARWFAPVGMIAVAAAAFAADEAHWIAVLKSGATHKEKADACRELAHVGTAKAVPVLASLLGDESLSHMARYALEPIRDPAVDAALREALGKVRGRPLVGVIGSLGVRRDAKAVDALSKLLADPDAEVAQAAARALGNIGTIEAAKAIESAMAGASGTKLMDFSDGLFRCAESLAAQGQTAEALRIYDSLRGLARVPVQVRAGAVRGSIVLLGKDGIPRMIEAIRGEDYALAAAAARTAMELRGPEVTAALASVLPGLPSERQILVANTLGHRGDAAAGAALLALASQGPESVRLAAVRNVTRLGYAPALALLAELSLSGEGELASTARECLVSFPGREAEAAIAAMLGHKDAKVRALAVEMIAQRRAGQAAASLLKAAEDREPSVRLAALRALRDQAGQAELPAMLAILLKAPSTAEIQAAENALGALCARLSGPAGGNVVILKAQYGDLPAGASVDVTDKVAAMVKSGALAVEASNGNFGDPAHGIVKKLRVDYSVGGVRMSKTVAEGESIAFTAISAPPPVVDAICDALGGAQGEAKLALLRVLRTAGGPKALETVQAIASGNDAAAKDAALRVLCDWPTADALPAVAEILKSPPSRTLKVLALRGFVRLVPQQEASDAQKLAALTEAMGLADRDEEKRLVLSALGNLATAEALAAVAAHLDNAALREEACLAAVAIAERLDAARTSEVVATMKRVAQLTGDKKLAARAKALAQKAKQ